jgi:hypothetical protein
MLFISIIIIGLILAGITYGILFVFERSSFLTDTDIEDEKRKLSEYEQRWSPVEVYSVKGTRFYSIVKTKDNRYFLVNHLSPKFSAINIFKKVDKWYAYAIDKSDAERLQEKNPLDYTMIGFATVNGLLGIAVSRYKVARDYWLTNRLAICVFILLALIGLVVGVIRMTRSVNEFKRKEKKLFINSKQSVIKLKSNQKHILYYWLVWLVSFYWLPVALYIKILFISMIFEEYVVRLYSSIGKVKKKKFR